MILDIDSYKLCGLRMSQSIPYSETNFDKTVDLEKLLSQADNTDTDYIL